MTVSDSGRSDVGGASESLNRYVIKRAVVVSMETGSVTYKRAGVCSRASFRKDQLKSQVTHFHTELQHFTGLGPANHGPADATGPALLVHVSRQETLS
ncbi:hypothetical protein MHYP_G00258300 [Metynnis hypsauchen]